MNRSLSLVVYFIGLLVVIAAIWVLFNETGLQQYIPITVAIAVLILILGIGVMASSDRFSSRRRVADTGYVREDRVVHDRVAPETGPRVERTVEEERRY